MFALLLGSVLAVGALAFVLWPILYGAGSPRVTSRGATEPDAASALDALREIEFDRATGKLSTEDYDTLRARYAPRAVEELRAREAAVAGAVAGAASMAEAPLGDVLDPAEALIARARALRGLTCPADGPRPESDALFCSDCGRYLGTSCLKCGAAIEDPHARFCAECGTPLAA
jgi:hypothetical protein